ncbi:DNA-processing protein DprA [Lentzea aerocolonigenes]|uniref:DNA-processing protein DprA n=1 Tax=Lentzea aerocolonigenes TaxID=68170 RepID=UPI0009DDB254|nr:DNA-processing protein DprA [Lentzea aerocolonigenes]MCP2244624.1 DNA processing protein [Lentzea aerocolonigenes]
MSSDAELRARLYLLRVSEPPAPALQQYVAVHGPVEAVVQIREGTAPAAVLGEIRRSDIEIDDDLDAIERGEARLLTPEHDDWPFGRFSGLTARGAPLALWLKGKGSLADITKRAVTVTGSRAASAYGHSVAEEFGNGIAREAVTVVSCGSYGIGSAAIRGALSAGGRAVVVLANGVDLAHPRPHTSLYRAVIDDGGLLVSEYPFGATPARHRFHARCRLLAALTGATVVVEAGRRSGSFAVVGVANELGRRSYGVPGSIYSASSLGVHELLRTGAATLATSVEHIAYEDGLQ